jgi:hypothetical protein
MEDLSDDESRSFVDVSSKFDDRGKLAEDRAGKLKNKLLEDWVKKSEEFVPHPHEEETKEPVAGTAMEDLIKAIAQALGAAASNFRGGRAEKSSKSLARQSTSKELP